MPYSYPDNIPSAVKNLPPGAQKIFITTFNAVLKESGDENQARRAGWRSVKIKYKRNRDGTWTLKSRAELLVDKYVEMFDEPWIEISKKNK